MSIFGNKKELKALAALKGVDADAVTAEQIAAVNAELAEAGINGVVLAQAGAETITAEAAAALNQQITDLTTANGDLSAELASFKAQAGEGDEQQETEETTPGGDDDDEETAPLEDEPADDFNARINAKVSSKFHIPIPKK
jgi:hypothetical protein